MFQSKIREEGKKGGSKEGRKEGRKGGREEGRKERIKKGREEGRKGGKNERVYMDVVVCNC